VTHRPAPSRRPLDERRREELAAGLEQVRSRIAAACADADRAVDDVTLVVVTKFFPASDVRHLFELGVRHVGENRHQEAADKHRECEDLDLTWHFIGGLQSNKAAAVGSWADVVQSVDRAKLLPGLSRAAHARRTPIDVLVQVSLHGTGAGAPDGRSGAAPGEAAALAHEVLVAPDLRLRGVMGVAPSGGDPGAAFGLLADVARQVRAAESSATWISAGMSGDLEQAIKHGATHVRVGTAVLGNRPVRG
jgi:pyridoxal phosphate enzyme (YggS family)